MILSIRSTPQATEPIEIIADRVLCQLRIWSEEEWAAIPDERRPQRSVHVARLGWVGAVPIPSLTSVPFVRDLPAVDARRLVAKVMNKTTTGYGPSLRQFGRRLGNGHRQ
jgi:hypothetical protein